MDGSTDDATVEQESIFLRTYVNGQLLNRFVCVGQPLSSTAEHLHMYMKRIMGEFGLEEHLKKLMGFGQGVWSQSSCDQMAGKFIKL